MFSITALHTLATPFIGSLIQNRRPRSILLSLNATRRQFGAGTRVTSRTASSRAVYRSKPLRCESEFGSSFSASATLMSSCFTRSSSSSVRSSKLIKRFRACSVTRISSSILSCRACGVSVLGVLDEEHHQKGHDGCAGVDHQLPRVRKAEQWATDRPNDHNNDRDRKGMGPSAFSGCPLGGSIEGGADPVRHLSPVALIAV